MSHFWGPFLRAMYALLGLVDPILRAWWSRFGLGNVVELLVPGRRTGRSRSVLVGLLIADGRRYLGHPNGAVNWVRNVEAAGRAELGFPDGARMPVRFTPLAAGPEREAAIRATWTQHPFPGDLVYRLARSHVRRAGIYFRLDPIED